MNSINEDKHTKVLFFFTINYPYGKGETFIENEITYLSEAFEKVIIFPMQTLPQKREIPNNVEVVELIDLSKYSVKSALKGSVFIFIKIIFLEFIKGHLFKNGKYLISNTLRILYKSALLINYFEVNKIKINNTVFYTYWFDEWATILSVLKEKKHLNKFISRVHGFDLYEERQKLNFIPYRYFQLKNVYNLYSISIHGSNYLRIKYKKFAKKIHTSFLGTKDHGYSNIKKSDKISILSISSIIPLKRVDLIAKTLTNCKKNIKWTHFGDGPLENELKELIKILPDNIETNFQGRKLNKDVLSFISQNYIDIFINVSNYEGIPVSIMETISFGIPIFATDVGGTSEIVNENTGKLYSVDINKKEFAKDIDNIKESTFSKENFRIGVRKFWKNNFNAEKNYQDFYKQIIS